MSWLQFWKRKEPDAEDASSRTISTPPEAPPTLPPHVREALASNRAATPPTSTEDATARTLNAIKRKRLAALYDIEQGELAQSPDNPWANRIELLTEALATVAADIRAAERVVPGPFHPLPTTPLVVDGAIDDDLARLTASVNGAAFTYEEDPDWAERGHQIARAELTRRSGDIRALIPGNTPSAMREDLTSHLDHSLDVFANDMRDRMVDGEALPDGLSLADLSPPCPVCGGWTDWRGTCQSCTHRAAVQQSLRREHNRLLDERAAEAEERHRLVERLPVARRRLRDVDAELAAVEARQAATRRTTVSGE